MTARLWKTPWGYLKEEDEDLEQRHQANTPWSRHMLEHAQAEKMWGRRSWLVLCCSCPAKVQLANTDSKSSRSDSSTEVGSFAKMIRPAAKVLVGGATRQETERLMRTLHVCLAPWLDWTQRTTSAWWWDFCEEHEGFLSCLRSVGLSICQFLHGLRFCEILGLTLCSFIGWQGSDLVVSLFF